MLPLQRVAIVGKYLFSQTIKGDTAQKPSGDDSVSINIIA
jgi:hypothetical protein